MRYAQIVPFDVCNGEGIGCSLFIQGCHFRCQGCFNQEAWDFDGGKEWTDEVENEFLDVVSKHFIERISILGGEPLEDKNLNKLYHLVKLIKELHPDKKIWLFTGYTFNELESKYTYLNDERQLVLKYCDVLVEGRFEENEKDITLKFRGSRNQNIWKKENGIWVKVND